VTNSNPAASPTKMKAGSPLSQAKKQQGKASTEETATFPAEMTITGADSENANSVASSPTNIPKPKLGS